MYEEYKGFSLTCREEENLIRIGKLKKEDLKTAGNYKELGDCYINSYLNKYADDPTIINNEHAERSFEAYEKACKIYKDTDCHKKYMGAMMALGNAYKEAVLPCHYDDQNFIDEKYKKAKESYQHAIDHYYENGKAFRKEYYFTAISG